MKQTIFFDRYCICGMPEGTPEEVSRSGASINYKAIDTRSGESVALQLIPLAVLDEQARKQFEELALTVEKLNHINIARVYAVGVQCEYLALASEYLRGETADAWVVARGPMSPDAVLRIGIQVLRALAVGAFHGLSHRAIQPSNIMILHAEAPDGGWPMIKLLNFGVAASESHQQSSNEEFSPTLGPQFASPEQLLNGKTDFRSEIYSLGAAMSFLLTGRVPLPPNRAAIYGGMRTASELRYLPRPLARLLRRMLHENPEKRPQDPVALEAQMQKCLAKSERRVGRHHSFLAPVSLPGHGEVVRWRSPRLAVLRGAFAGAVLVAVAAVTSALLLPRVAAMWHHESPAKPIGGPVGVSQPERTNPPAAVAAQPVAPSPPPSVARTPEPSITQKLEVADASRQDEQSSPAESSRTESDGDGYSSRRESETVSSNSSSSGGEPVTMEKPSRSNRVHASGDQNENARSVARALPVESEEAEADTDVTGDAGHPRFIGLSPDGRAILRLPSGETVTVSRRSNTKRYPRAERVRSSVNNPPQSESDPGD
jgi:serine/threonine protein kinase